MSSDEFRLEHGVAAEQAQVRIAQADAAVQLAHALARGFVGEVEVVVVVLDPVARGVDELGAR